MQRLQSLPRPCGLQKISYGAPSIPVMAQVNVACRASALAPGVADSLAAFAGVYCAHALPDIAGKPADAGPELAISVSASGVFLGVSRVCMYPTRKAWWKRLQTAPHTSCDARMLLHAGARAVWLVA